MSFSDLDPNTQKHVTDLFWSKVDKSGNCWLWLGGKSDRGYGKLTVHGKQVRAHRFAWEFTNKEAPTQNILHSCDNPLCVRPSHLWQGTQLDNIRDCIAKGRHKIRHFKGGDHPRALLTEADVLAIRAQPVERGTIVRLAHEYQTSESTIAAVLHRQTWKHI